MRSAYNLIKTFCSFNPKACYHSVTHTSDFSIWILENVFWLNSGKHTFFNYQSG